SGLPRDDRRTRRFIVSARALRFRSRKSLHNRKSLERNLRSNADAEPARVCCVEFVNGFSRTRGGHMNNSANRSFALAAAAAIAVSFAPAGASAQSYYSGSNAPTYYAPVAPSHQDSVFAPSLRDESTGEIARFQRQVVNYATHEVPGTIVIDTPNTYLYLVL